MTRRAIVFAVVLVAAAAIVVASAHEERHSAGTAILVTGFAVLGVLLGAIAWWRGAWSPRGNHLRLVFGLLGLLFLAVGGPAAVAGVILAHRGTPTEVEAVRVRPFAGGGGDYTLVPAGGSTPLRGDLRDDLGLVGGQRFTVLADRARFVRPMLPEDVDPAFPALYVLTGTAFLGAAVLRGQAA